MVMWTGVMLLGQRCVLCPVCPLALKYLKKQAHFLRHSLNTSKVVLEKSAEQNLPAWKSLPTLSKHSAAPKVPQWEDAASGTCTEALSVPTLPQEIMTLE